MLKSIKTNLKVAQHRMIQQANKKINKRVFVMGNWVYIKLQLYRQRSVVTKESHKLSHKFYSPYQVIEHIRTMAYKLCLPLLPQST
jgi:hypothetical protein